MSSEENKPIFQRRKAVDEATEAKLKAIDKATLTLLVRRALGCETVEVIDWDYQELHGGASGSRVYRLAGSGQDRGETFPWSLILKVIHPSTDINIDSDNLSSFVYWKREPLAYESGLLDDLPGSLVAPECFGIVEQPGEEVWIWLEEVTDEIGPRWPLERYGIAARHLGQFNGAYLAGQPLPPYPWLSRGWVRTPPHFVRDRTVSGIAKLRSSLENPLVHRWFPADSADRLLRLWEEREMLLDAFDRLPQTLCHHDAFRRNLFVRRSADGRDQTVAVDWAFVGKGMIGEEIVTLVQTSLFFQEADLAEAPELDEIAFEGYLEGLRDAGWRGDPRMVRFGYTAASALRNVSGMGAAIPFLLDESRYVQMEQRMGRPIEEMMNFFAETVRLMLNLGDEARELLDSLRFLDKTGK